MSTNKVLVPAVVGKKDVGIADAMIGVIMGAILTAFAIVDLSIISYSTSTGNVSLASSYFEWKADAPIIKYILLVVVVFLPIALIQVIGDFIQTFTRKASKIRNIVDIVNLVSLSIILVLMVTVVGPLENTVRIAADELTKASSISEEAGLHAARVLVATVQQLYSPVLYSVILNIIQISYPIIRYCDSLKNIVPAEVTIEKKTE